MRIRNLLCFIISFSIALFSTCAHADDLRKNIFISNAWVQAMPHSQKTTAAYMLITNNSNRQVVLLSVSSDIAGAAEIHQMSHMNGMMHMAMTSALSIPAMGRIALKPGGFHIMLINLKKPVNKGDIVPIRLHFQGGSVITVNAKAHDQ